MDCGPVHGVRWVVGVGIRFIRYKYSLRRWSARRQDRRYRGRGSRSVQEFTSNGRVPSTEGED